MLNHVLLASAVAVSVPALAQAQETPQSGAGRTPITAPAAQGQAAQPETVQADRAPTTAVAPDQATRASDPAQPAATAAQVAEAVDQDFPTYDRNGDGTLDEPEFAAWMAELRTASDPSVTAGSPGMKTWTGRAFAAADTDKNAALSKGELTAFLSQGVS